MAELKPIQLYKTITACRLCSSTDLRRTIPLVSLPVTSPNVGRNRMVAETAPSDVYQCENCGFLQLSTVVDPEFQYRGFKYFTGLSVGLREHFGALVETLVEAGEVAKGKFVFEIGSNDGSLLRFVQDRDARVLGIDPAESIAEAANEAGIPTIADFFNETVAKAIAAEHGKAEVIISNNTIANIDDLDDFFAGIDAVMAPDGLFIIETQYALDVLEKTLLDVIYHEHVSYFAALPMKNFLDARDFELVDAERIAPKGGSIRFYIQRKGGPRQVTARLDGIIAGEKAAGLYAHDIFDDFNTRIGAIGGQVRDGLDQSRARMGRALVYGASVGCAALVHYFDLTERIDAVFDDMPLTNFMRTSSGSIPVLSGQQLDNEEPADVVVLAWRYTQNIASNHEDFSRAGGRFFHVLPDFSCVE